MKIRALMTAPFTPLEDKSVNLVIFKNGEAVVPPELTKAFITSCQKYARKFKVYLSTCLYRAGESLCLALISPEGEILGAQRGTHINLLLTGEIKPYDEIEIIPTPLGKIFLAVDTDIYHPEVLRLAIFQDCDFIISSQMIPMVDFNEDRIFFGARSAAAANRIYILHTTTFSSALLCPPELTADGSGFLAYPTGKSQTVEFDWEDAVISRKALMDSLLGSNFLNHYQNILGK